MDAKQKCKDLFYWTEALYWFFHSDIILTNGGEQVIGIRYLNNDKHKPNIAWKYDWWQFYYLLHRVSKIHGIPFIENKLLVNALYSEINYTGAISGKYHNIFEAIYDRLPKLDFKGQLKKDISLQFYRMTRADFKKIAIKAIKDSNKIADLNSKRKFNFIEELHKIAELNHFEFKETKNHSTEIQEYYLEYFNRVEINLDEDKPDFWLMVLIHEDFIYVGNQFVFQYFEGNEKAHALNFIKAIVEGKNKYCGVVKRRSEEFNISEEVYEEVSKSFIKILSDNFDAKGIDYGYWIDKSVLAVYFEKKNEDFLDKARPQKKKRRMYMIGITYKEFLNNKDTFKKVIEKPYIFEKWKFCCREKAYNQDCFKKIIMQ